MSERADRDFLSDIQEGIHRIHDYTASMTYEAFLADIKTQDAVIRNLEIVGEATKNLSAGLRDRYPTAEESDTLLPNSRLVIAEGVSDVESWSQENLAFITSLP